MTSGPYLYDDGPEALHTGPSRSRRGLVLGIFGGTAVVAVGMGVLLPVVTGSGDDQARQVTGVFLKALQQGDTETAYGLLCDTERSRITQAQVPSTFLGATPGTIASVAGAHRNGTAVELVVVRWNDGSSSRYTLVNQGGARICGTQPLG